MKVMKRALLIGTLALLAGSCVCYPYGYCGREVVCLPQTAPPCPAPVVVTRVVHVHGPHCGHVFLHGAWVAVR